MIEILLAMVGPSFGLASGYFLFRRKPEDSGVEPLNSLVCPYCQNVITGFKELDLIHHVACIGKSKADLEAEAKKPKSAKDEYLITTDRLRCNWDHKYRNPSKPWVYVAHDTYQCFEYVLYRNGTDIAKGWSETAENARKAAAAKQTVDEHKRRTAGRK